MTTLKTFAKRFWRDETGVTSIEYGVLGVLLVAAIATALTTFSGDLSTAFATIGTKLKTGAPA
jgi:pilus assembly protein Flp/PilA